MSIKVDLYNLKDAERCFTATFNKWLDKKSFESYFDCFYTLPPNKDRYDDYVGAAYKIIFHPSASKSIVCCYIFFRLSRATALTQPRLSSIEVFTSDPYKTSWKRHVRDYAQPIGIILEAVYACLSLVPYTLLTSPIDFSSEYISSLSLSAKDACIKVGAASSLGGISYETV